MHSRPARRGTTSAAAETAEMEGRYGDSPVRSAGVRGMIRPIDALRSVARRGGPSLLWGYCISMSGARRRLVLSYGLAAVGVVLAGSSPWWLSPLTGETPPMRLMLVLVVTAAAWLGGLGPGLLATVMGLWAIVLA